MFLKIADVVSWIVTVGFLATTVLFVLAGIVKVSGWRRRRRIERRRARRQELLGLNVEREARV